MEKTQHTRDYRKLVAALRKAREAAGLTQQQVAQELGLYASFVSKVEKGERRLDVVELAAFCRVYQADLVRLLRDAGITG